MRKFFPMAGAGLLTLLLAANAQAGGKASKAKDTEEATCGDFGTSVHFEKTPSDAARKALKEQKLVCVLHISGYFEEPDFT